MWKDGSVHCVGQEGEASAFSLSITFLFTAQMIELTEGKGPVREPKWLR